MKIDTNSWHYKLNHRMYGSEVPAKLCPYFWATVLSVTVLSWLEPILNAAFNYFDHIHLPSINIGFFKFLSKYNKVFSYSVCGGLAGYGSWSFFFNDNPFGLFNVGMGIGLAIWLTISPKVYMRFGSKTGYVVTKKKNPSMTREYLKAKHSLVCPPLDFVDMKKEEFNNYIKKLEDKQIPDMMIFDDVSFALDKLSDEDKKMMDRKYQEFKKKHLT